MNNEQVKTTRRGLGRSILALFIVHCSLFIVHFAFTLPTLAPERSRRAEGQRSSSDHEARDELVHGHPLQSLLIVAYFENALASPRRPPRSAAGLELAQHQPDALGTTAAAAER